jgi:citrate lyase beta subunit
VDALDTAPALSLRRPLVDGVQLQEREPPQKGVFAGGQNLGVLLPPLEDALIEDTIRAAIRWHARAVILPQVTQAAMLQHLDVLLTVIEAEENLPGAPLRIAAYPADTAEGAAFARDFRRMSARLEALIWDDQAFCRAAGLAKRTAPGAEPEMLRTARSLFLLSAKAAGVVAIDTASDTNDAAAFSAECLSARQQGFAARIATLPVQADIIDSVFAAST